MDLEKEELLKSKAGNIFVKLHNAIMKKDLEDIKHFLGKDLYDQVSIYVNDLKEKENTQIYDEINVKDIHIISHSEGNYDKIEMILTSKYFDYVIDKNANLIRGSDTTRIERKNDLVFVKKDITKEDGLVKRCPGCGASINVNNSGKCEYCGATFDLENYDYVLIEYKVVK